MQTSKNDFISKIKKIKGLEYIIVGVVGLLVAFVLFGEKITSCEGSNKTSGQSDTYVSSIEDKLEETISRISGAGKVSIAVSVSGGKRTVVAKDVVTVKNGNEVQTTETTVILGGKVVVLCELYPEVTGVLVVAGGADNLSVKLKILSAVTTLLDVEEDRVVIIKGK